MIAGGTPAGAREVDQEALLSPLAVTGMVKVAPWQALSELLVIRSPPGTVNTPMVFFGTSHDTLSTSPLTITPVSRQPASRCAESAVTLPLPGLIEVIRTGKSFWLVTV